MPPQKQLRRSEIDCREFGIAQRYPAHQSGRGMLTEVLRHAEDLKQNPPEWMPWNYRDTLARLAILVAA